MQKCVKTKQFKELLVDVWCIPSFTLETEDGCFEWKNLHVAITDKKAIGCHLILSYTMFQRLSLNFVGNTKYPTIEISGESKTKYMFVKQKIENDFSRIQFIYAQENSSKPSTEDSSENLKLSQKKSDMKDLDVF